jgi:hypothetical protein
LSDSCYELVYFVFALWSSNTHCCSTKDGWLAPMIDFTVLLKRFTVAYAFLAQLVNVSKMGVELVNLHPFPGVRNQKALLYMQKEIPNALGAILLPL